MILVRRGLLIIRHYSVHYGFIFQPISRFDELPDEFDPSGKFGSFDDGDPQTTNLYVGNLSPQVLSSCMMLRMTHLLIDPHHTHFLLFSIDRPACLLRGLPDSFITDT